jgi:hypothetical protein
MKTNKKIVIIALLIGIGVVCYLMWRKKNPVTPKVPNIGPIGPNIPDVPHVDPTTAYVNDYNLPPELQGMSGEQMDAMMHEKYQKPLEYRDTRELLAEPNADPLLFDKDVRNPLTFNTTRTITGPWKQRNQDEGDFLRGDLPSAPRAGAWEDKWFNSRYGPANIKKGAFTEYLNTNTWGNEMMVTNDHPVIDAY